jgi:hypothetical protein
MARRAAEELPAPQELPGLTAPQAEVERRVLAAAAVQRAQAGRRAREAVLSTGRPVRTVRPASMAATQASLA